MTKSEEDYDDEYDEDDEFLYETGGDIKAAGPQSTVDFQKELQQAKTHKGHETKQDIPEKEENPFATFLAARRKAASKTQATTWSPQSWKEARVTSPLPGGDNFSTFLGEEQLLRDEVARAKKMLLEVTLETERRALHPSAKQDDANSSLQRLRRANDYLRSAADSADIWEGGRETPNRGQRSANADIYGQRMDPLSPVQQLSFSSKASPLGMSSSMPNLQASTTSSFLPSITGSTSRPMAASDQPLSPVSKDEPLLSGWWSKTRMWNVAISKRDTKARRQTLGLPGGTVVLGNGRMPSFHDSRLLAKGYFFAIQIDDVDDDNFPPGGVKDMALVLGVSRYPARSRRCERPMYAYEVPDATVVGYGGHLIDRGKWYKTPWDPSSLKQNDIVGLLVSEEGDLVIYVNEEQVLRVKTSLGFDNSNLQATATTTPEDSGDPAETLPPRKTKSPKAAPPKRVLFPIVDLHGRVSAVTILPRQAPPNKPLACRKKLQGQ